MDNTVTQQDIDNILEKTKWTVEEFHGKCTVVVILTESSSCANSADYDVNIGIECCKGRIINKIWELEGYRLQCELAKFV